MCEGVRSARVCEECVCVCVCVRGSAFYGCCNKTY